MKRDNSIAVKALRDGVGQLLGRVTPRSPPQSESQSKGRIARAGKTSRGLVRVMKD